MVSFARDVDYDIILALRTLESELPPNFAPARAYFVSRLKSAAILLTHTSTYSDRCHHQKGIEHTNEAKDDHKYTINASDARTDTLSAPPLTATASKLSVPCLAHAAENVPPPPIVTAAPWSVRAVASGAVSRFACLVPPALASPVNCTDVLERVPVPLK